MKTKEIRELIDFISQTGLNEVNIETEELKLSIKRDAEVKVTEAVHATPAPAPAAAPAPTPATQETEKGTSQSENSSYVEIKAPMIGTFYNAANPESDPFVKPGDSITAGQTVCIIEAMKLFNEIEAEISGKIVKILVDDSSPVEYDQPLFLVDPS